MAADARRARSRAHRATADVQNLTVSALLRKLMNSADTNAGQVKQLLDRAGELGLADTSLAALNGSARA